MTRIAAILLAGFVAGTAMAQDRHEGYYYPPVSSDERFERVLLNAPPAGRDVRVEFVTVLTKAQLAAPESPRFVFFAKGEQARDLIVVALDDQVFKTRFRARAVLAQMTSNIRGSEFFRDQGLQSTGTFYDMLQMLAFDSLVVSDGETWAHRVDFIRN